MSRLSKLVELCSNSVIIYINQHRNYYQAVAEYIASLSDRNGGDYDIGEINKETLSKMIETDTIVEITIYPNNAIGSFDIFHYDVDKAVDLAITIAEHWSVVNET